MPKNVRKIKRKSGRPLKRRKEENNENDPAFEPTLKKKRGRPRKSAETEPKMREDQLAGMTEIERQKVKEKKVMEAAVSRMEQEERGGIKVERRMEKQEEVERRRKARMERKRLGKVKKSGFFEMSAAELETKKNMLSCKKRHRFGMCKKCPGCLRTNCGECVFCLDMPKFGGRFVMKQKCKKRACCNPTPSRCDQCTWAIN